MNWIKCSMLDAFKFAKGKDIEVDNDLDKPNGDCIVICFDDGSAVAVQSDFRTLGDELKSLDPEFWYAENECDNLVRQIKEGIKQLKEKCPECRDYNGNLLCATHNKGISS